MMRAPSFREAGFTLIELLMVMVIVAVLAAVAYPAYTGHIARSHRADARAELLRMQMAVEKQRLATLGDDSAELTCSMHVARRWGGARETVGCSSVEAARELLRPGRADALLVPAAYPRLNTFIMDEALLASQVFIMPIPALVLATCTGPIAPRLQQLIHHAAVTPLLPELGLCWVQARQADSNAEACRLLQAAPEPSACITNALCAAHFGLNVVRELRPKLAMPWICFVHQAPSGTRSAPGPAEARP
jgi:prepilin-type N-terminal cleavage/methylation domain-containing protein